MNERKQNQLDPARRVALTLLQGVLADRVMLSDLTEAQTFQSLAPAEQAAAQRLTLSCLRSIERADRLISRHMKRRPKPIVQNIMRLAVSELAMGGNAYAVVDQAVSLAHASGQSRAGGLINAVLRKIADQDIKAWQDLRIPRIPDWLRKQLIKAHGKAAIAAIEAVQFATPPLDITAHDPDQWVEKLGAHKLPNGSLRLQAGQQVSNLPGFAEGAWWVQDAAAALPVQILNPQPGEQILDLCAAPGGKTLQLAATGADVVAVDISESRLKRLHQNLKRTGLNATVLTEDALTHQGSYDAILLDAPCTATGTIRRHPDLPHAKRGMNIKPLLELQSNLLTHALSLLKSGGRLIYCTCSLLPEEGEEQIKFLSDTYKTDPDALQISGVYAKWITPEGGLRLRPDYWADHGGMDGFYIAVIKHS